jgi:hypothetical protein
MNGESLKYQFQATIGRLSDHRPGVTKKDRHYAYFARFTIRMKAICSTIFPIEFQKKRKKDTVVFVLERNWFSNSGPSPEMCFSLLNRNSPVLNFDATCIAVIKLKCLFSRFLDAPINIQWPDDSYHPF